MGSLLVVYGLVSDNFGLVTDLLPLALGLVANFSNCTPLPKVAFKQNIHKF
jgi:hypothetical protein